MEGSLGKSGAQWGWLNDIITGFQGATEMPLLPNKGHVDLGQL